MEAAGTASSPAHANTPSHFLMGSPLHVR
jgi:hypothetical protein